MLRSRRRRKRGLEIYYIHTAYPCIHLEIMSSARHDRWYVYTYVFTKVFVLSRFSSSSLSLFFILFFFFPFFFPFAESPSGGQKAKKRQKTPLPKVKKERTRKNRKREQTEKKRDVKLAPNMTLTTRQRGAMRATRAMV